MLRLPSHAARLAWLVANLPRLDGSGIIYCLTVATANDVAEHLRSHGLEVAAYSGQTDPAERLAAEDNLLGNRVKALVATSALGMGFDKPDLGFVIHLGAPPSPIAYYQQVGRAGRGVDEAVVVLLPGVEDVDIWAYFGSLSFPPERDVRAAIAALESEDGPMSTGVLETRVTMPRGRLEAMLKVLDVDGAVRRVRGGWTSTGQPWTYDADRYARVAETRRVEQRSMLEYEDTSQCRLEFLRRALDDPGAEPCGRCDNCGTLELDAAVDEASLEEARQRLARPGVTVEPRKMWPTAMQSLGVERSGRIPAAEQAEPGRAVARLTDLGWGNQLRELFAPGVADGEVPVALRRAVVEVLDAWDFGADGGPDVIVGVDSASRPLLVRHLAAGLARYTGWPEVGRFVVADGARTPPDRVNSAHRLAAVVARLRLEDTSGVRRQTRTLARRPHRHGMDARGRREPAAPRRRRGCLPAGTRRSHLGEPMSLRARSTAVCAAVVLVTGVAGAAVAAPAEIGPHPTAQLARGCRRHGRRPGHRRPLLPARRQRGVRRPALRHRRQLRHPHAGAARARPR